MRFFLFVYGKFVGKIAIDDEGNGHLLEDRKYPSTFSVSVVSEVCYLHDSSIIRRISLVNHFQLVC